VGGAAFVRGAALAVIAAGFAWNAATLIRLHPYQYLVFNPLVGGLRVPAAAFKDYWFTNMPEAVDGLEPISYRTTGLDP